MRFLAPRPGRAAADRPPRRRPPRRPPPRHRRRPSSPARPTSCASCSTSCRTRRCGRCSTRAGRRPRRRRPASDAADSMAGGLGGELSTCASTSSTLALAVPRLPEEFGHARSMLGDMLGRGDALSLALFVPLFVALGFGGECAVPPQHAAFRPLAPGLPLDTVKERVSAVFARFALRARARRLLRARQRRRHAAVRLGRRGSSRCCWRCCSPPSSRGSSPWSGDSCWRPGAPRFRVVPVDTPSAAFLFRRLVAAWACSSASARSSIDAARQLRLRRPLAGAVPRRRRDAGSRPRPRHRAARYPRPALPAPPDDRRETPSRPTPNGGGCAPAGRVSASA